MQHENTTRLKKAFEDAVERGQVLGAQIETGNAHEAVTSMCLGHIDDSKKSKVTDDTLFAICSVTKPIVATAAVRLAESKKLDLNTPVEDLLVGLLAKTTKRRRASHTISNRSRVFGASLGNLFQSRTSSRGKNDAQVKEEMIRAVRDLSWSLEECVERICERPLLGSTWIAL